MKTLKQKIEEGREYRDAQSIEVRATDDQYSFVGYATTFDSPYFLYQIDDIYVYEQISSKAFENCDMSDVIMQYNHEGHVYARMSNNTLELEFDDHGIKCQGNLKGTTIGRQLQEELDGGYTTKMSWGFSIVPDTDTVELMKEDEDGNRYYLRTINQVSKIWDVSAVSLPANEQTEISGQRTLEGAIKELETERMERLEKERRTQIKRKVLAVKVKAMKGANNGN